MIGPDDTQVELLWLEGQIERWIRFGRLSGERLIDRRRRIVGFAPGAVFAFVRWRSGDYGTVESRITIMRAVGPRAAFTTVPLVAPGAELLLDIAGWPKVQAVLAAIDTVELTGVRPEDAAPDHWRHVHSRILVGLAPRTYNRMRHRAWRLRQGMGL
ncbi:DUF2840 domain-containing protein [Caulobacter sp. 602-1]|uniref:DUF2840 domain-containing protein n=1 Tax=Caulobacter sp. 602-1 TaxID=2492472 RepID=UPI000F63DDB4|nr:DUF2840 domain-containing protein [Caulobacter sp. 602-1]RRN63459.1 DUF2840 domain-containing protein [Caulobacter sp. 602-1]